MKRAMFLAAAALLALAACDEKKPETKADESTETKNVAVTATTPAPVTIEDSDLATVADFEEDAEKAITKENYKQELASLEKEIATE